jgi:mannosyltransferase OCH1-like enzyme
MRRGLILFLLANLVIIGTLVNYVFTLITLLFEDCSADAIHPADIPAPNSELIGQRMQYIPKILHQTWENESIPFKWQKAQKSCIELHGDYEYMVGFTVRSWCLGSLC